MLKQYQVDAMSAKGRHIETAVEGDEELGPLKLLPGTWQNLPNLPGRGWNMIALPFATEPGSRLNYRLLLNQYNETLRFSLVDKAVANRGIGRVNGVSVDTDQFVVALDYEQSIQQIAAADFPVSGKAGASGLAIHHEPGLFLFMTNEADPAFDLARLATIPHGDSVLALGNGTVSTDAQLIPDTNGFPVGVTPDLTSPYLAPYKHFHENPFLGLFDPTEPEALLAAANTGVNIVRTTTLHTDSTVPTGGILNIPFVVKQANAATMRSTFWIQELAELDAHGHPKLRLQYIQVVLLDFFATRDGSPGLIRWPHISINTMEKVDTPVAPAVAVA